MFDVYVLYFEYVYERNLSKNAHFDLFLNVFVCYKGGGILPNYTLACQL